MASTYSSIATHMWPPPSSDTASRIQRLQELEQMRKQRQANSVMQINSEPTDATTRLSRRQQIGGHSIGMRKLVDGHEERRKTLLGRRALNENRSSEMNNSLSMSQGSIDSSTYHGGARPKNFDISSVRKIALSHPGEVIGRERSSSLTNSETSSNVPLLRSQSITGLPDQSESCDNVEQIYDKENFPTKEIETVTNTSISEDEEDIESFKRSLLGIQSFTPVSEKDEPVLQQRLPTLRRHENEIDTSKLIIHRTDRKEKTFSMPITETTSGRSSQGRIQNLVTDSMKRLDSLFGTPKLSSTKSETLPRNYRFSPTTERVSHRSKITEVKSLRERIKDRKDVTSKVQEQQDQINSHQLRNSNQQENNTFRPPITSDAIEIVENQIENEVEGKVYTKVNNGIQITGSFTSLQLSQSGTVNESFQNQVRSPVPNNMNSLQDDVTTEPDDKPHDIAKCENEVTDEQTVQSSIISDNKACLETSAYENGQEDDNELPVGSKTTTYTHITEIMIDHSQLNNSLEQTGQQEIKDENMNETNNSYVYFMKKEQEDDLVDASNVEFFETNDVYSNFDGNTENENTSNFSQFSNTNDFLNYDQSVRNESEVNEKSLYGVNTDILPSRSFRSMSVDHRSGFGSHPYSRREQSMFHSYSGQEGVRKVSLGVSGISQDALSRINDLFGQKTETRTSDIVSSLPRKRARDTLVGSRTAISRSRSDVGEDTKFESRRTSLINRTNLDSQSDKGSNNQLGSYTDRQPSYISSFLTEEDIQSRREQNANHIEEIRNRIRMHTKGDYQSSSKVVNNFSLGENRFNSLPYMRSRSLDHDGENNTESVTFQNYDVNFSAENSDELISKINKLTSEISSEFFSNEDSQLEDSNNTLTPETEIEEILLEPNEMNKTEMPGDEELTFNTSCEVEVGEVLVCKTSEDYREETNVGDKNNSVESDDSKLPIAENDGKNSEIENLAKTEKLDSTVNEETKNDGEKNSLENLDETDNKSIASTTSSTSSSSKKKKNKKKGKKESNPPKVIVSHPSEILAKDKKAKKETKTKITSSVVGNGTKKEEKSIKKGKFFSKESKTQKVVQSKDKNEKTSSKPSAQTEKGKKEEPTSPNKDKNKQPENNTDSPKSQSKLKNLFDSLIHALDHKSETSSVTTLSVEDARSGSSGEKTPIADEWEIITEPAASDLNIIHEDNYATFTDEEIPEVKQRLDENGGMSTDNYETASDHTISGGSEYEEFYEALPTELLGNAWKESANQNETERKEQFVYVCAGSKVRRKRNPVQNIDGSNTDIINQWIANNLYPGDKYPEKGDKIANFKFTESSENDNTREKFESSILRQLKKTEFNANQSRNVPNDHEKTCIPNKDSVETELKSSNKTIGSVHVANKRAVSHQNSSEFQLSQDITAVDKEVPQAITVVDKEEQLPKLKYSGTTECLSSQGIKKEHNEPNIELVKSKSLENVHIKASDSSFTDTLITKLRDKLCTCCQGVLLDVLKETYFTRYEEISKINLTKSVNLTKPEHKEDQKICDNKLESSENIRLEDLKKHHKAKKLVVEDLLYEKSDESDSKPVSAVQNGKDEKMETDEQLNCNNTQEVESKETVQEKFKAPSLKLKDKLITPPKSDKTSPRKYSGEIKKGKTISIDKSNNKKEEKVSPKSEPRLCRQSSKTGDQESRRSDINKTINKENDKSKSDSEKGENDEEYKLPKLDENPFIKSDKLRTSFKKVDQSKKAESTVKTTMIKRSTNGTNDSSKPSSPQKSSPPFARGTNGSRKSDISVTDKTKTANGMEAVRPESFTNGNTVKSVETEKDKKLGSPKKTSPNGSKKPSMFDHLNFAKSVCETLGPKETNTNIDNKTDNLVKSHEHFESETVLKKTKTLPKKKRFSPFGDTDIVDEDEIHGIPMGSDDEVAPHRINLINWDPTKLLNVLYTVKLNKDTAEDVSHQFVNMEGLMEKLPMNKKKATLLKTWKRRFFRAKDGWLHYYEGLSEDEQTSNRDRPSDSVQLMGGKIEDLGNRVLGIDDGRGRFLMVRCPTEKEYGQWKLALESQTVNNVKATYVRPALSSPPHPEKKVIIIDIGSGGIRAGVMGAQPCLPQMFFPSVVARNKTTQELVIGTDAYKPDVRKNSTLVKLVEPSNKVDKFAIDMEIMSAVFDYIFKGLKIDSSKHWIMLSTPYKLGDSSMSNLMQILTDKFHTKGVCMVMQSLLALYSYNATSGIIVDVGERMEILPIFDGVLIEGGVSRQAYGGQKVADSLNSSLVELKYKFYTPVDKLLVRYVMEQSCYVCDNYKEVKSKCDKDSEDFQTTIYLNNFDLPDDAHLSVTHDLSCFKSPEGFFNTDLWGMDYPCVHKLVYQAIQTCPMDNRKHMYRAIYLSGGVTMLPGFAERLEAELKKLAPPSVVVEVHASPQRYHSAFIGAGTLLSNVPINEQIFISSEEWKRDGAKAFRKWKGP